MFRGKGDQRRGDAVHPGEPVEFSRLIGIASPNRIERLESGAAGAGRLEMTDGRFGIGPTPHDDILQMSAQRDFDGGFIVRRKRDQLGDRSLDPSELPGSAAVSTSRTPEYRPAPLS